MTLAQLRYLIAIVDAGLNITQAAAVVHATQPGLSKQLKQLEQWLGFALFRRRGKVLDALTEEGVEVVERARAILNDVARIRGLKQSFANDQGGEIRVATTHTQARFVLPNALAALKREWPALRLSVRPQEDAEALEALADGQADVAIVSGVEAPEDTLAVPLFQWHRQVLVPLGHALLENQPLTLQALSQYALITYASAARAGASLPRAFEAAGLPLHIGMAVSDGDLIKTYVRAGLGVGVVAPMALADSDSDLVALSLEHVFPRVTTWFAVRPEQPLTQALSAFVQSLAGHVDPWGLRQRLAGDGAVPLLKGPVPMWRGRA